MRTFLLFVLFAQLSYIASAQQLTGILSNEQEIRSKLYFANHYYPQQKIYLHVDRSLYYTNDPIWFKCYLINSPEPNSNVYVELINQTGKIIQKKMYLAIDGLAYGDFQIADTTSSGAYQVRAYTNWMRNFDESWFFRKDIYIWNLRDKIEDVPERKRENNRVDVQFFPEGGTLIAGQKSRMAFKATDSNGKGIPVSGVVLDNKGLELTAFESGFKGMGSFWFTPEADKSYTAVVKSNSGSSHIINLPLANRKGIALSVKESFGDTLSVKISANVPAGANDQAYLLVGQTRGQVIFTRSVNPGSGEQSLLIDKKSLPTGILQLTLFQEPMPLCERLVFINHNDFISLDIEPDKEKYTTREKVELNLKTLTKSGSAELANLSLSVFHSETQVELEKYPNNILTHFILNSELKGLIEEPAYYFKDDSISTLTALDNLMLTQGWRRFVWKEILAGKFPKIDFYPESALNIEGTVSTLFREKPLPNSKVLLQLGLQKKKVYTQQTDSLGRFYFDSLFFYVETPVEIRAESAKGNKRVWVSMNEVKEQSPVITYLPLAYQYVDETKIETSVAIYKSNSEYIKKKWSLSDTILLEEVSIYGRKERNPDVFIRPYLNPEYVIDVDEALKTYNANTMPELIEYTYPNIYANRRGDPMVFYVNGMIVEDPDVLLFDIDKIEISRFMPTAKGLGTIIYITTKRSRNQDVLSSRGSISTFVKGYDVITEYYSPSYESAESLVTKDDYRGTLYWHPNIWTNEAGMAKASFYNSNQTGKVQVIVEGISVNGKLCRGVGSYEVVP